MNKITILAMLVAAGLGLSADLMNLKINTMAQIEGGWMAAEGDSIKVVPEDSSFPTIAGVMNNLGEFTINDYIGSTPIHDTGDNTPLNKLNVISYQGTLGIQDDFKVVNTIVTDINLNSRKNVTIIE